MHESRGGSAEQARRGRVELAISNPCFELWLILCFQDHSSWLENDDTRRLRRQLHGSSDKGLEPAKYMPHIRDAARRAAARFDYGTGFGSLVVEAPRRVVRLITRRPLVRLIPPPPRPLVRRARRAGVQTPDQRFYVRAAVEGAGFSGVFHGALSKLGTHAGAGCARRDAAGELRVWAGGLLEVALRGVAAYACIGHAYALH